MDQTGMNQMICQDFYTSGFTSNRQTKNTQNSNSPYLIKHNHYHVREEIKETVAVLIMNQVGAKKMAKPDQQHL
jgi:hypothetical protein